MRRLAKHPAARSLLAALIGRYVAFALATTRWTVHGADHLAGAIAGVPVIAAFWHERLPMMPALWLRVRRASGQRVRAQVLVSRHRDGRVIGDVMGRFALGVLHGSTGRDPRDTRGPRDPSDARAPRDARDRGGAAATRAMLAALGRGEHVVITPDGPRGPHRVAAPGVAELAALARVPVLPCAAQTTRHRLARSWDRMVIPLPFGRGVFVVGAPIAVARDGGAAALPEIEAALTRAADDADRLCRVRARR